ncbi:MAG: prolyl oligopeptidase family serine peptidase, partial [Clostridia bacterium]|nr:prolyl oligopeptidase family serine peptidase [Clostridia bacterium]
FIKMMTGADFTDVQITNGEYRTEIDKISPANLVSAESVPTLCGYGLRDHVIPQNQKVLLVEAFEKTGAAYDYLEFPKSNHGMYADLDVLQRFIDMSLEYCEQYFK